MENEDVFDRIRRHFEERDTQKCRACGCDWRPEGWNFWGLCEDCFSKWQAVRRRAHPELGVPQGYYTDSTFEKWIKDGFPGPPSKDE